MKQGILGLLKVVSYMCDEKKKKKKTSEIPLANHLGIVVVVVF